ncbi:BA75_04014T0 [Komagataella pastoris]|uniref:BA75_04014T0 n=1 Tax=Komagataella pastoris TaxID=4922 RepID=A0A1B2JFK3_PICPA|nr:BA75_04014T0 [Komagataella pastoris]
MILLKNDEFPISVDKIGIPKGTNDWGGYSQRILSVVGKKSYHNPEKQSRETRKRKTLNRIQSFSGHGEGTSFLHAWKEKFKEKQKIDSESSLPQRKKRRVDYRSGLEYLTQKFNYTFRKESIQGQADWHHDDAEHDENETDEDYIMPLTLYTSEFLDSSSLLEDDIELKTTAGCHSSISDQSVMDIDSELSTGRNDEFSANQLASQSQTTASEDSSKPAELPAEELSMSPFLEEEDFTSTVSKSNVKSSNQTFSLTGRNSLIESYSVPTFNPTKEELQKLPLTINNPEFFDSLKVTKDKENKDVESILFSVRSASNHGSTPTVHPQGSIKFQGSAKLIIYSKNERTKRNIQTQNNSTIFSTPNLTNSPKSILKNSINEYAQAENVRAHHCDLVHIDDFIKLFETHEQNRISSEPFLSQIRQNQVQSYYYNIS